MNIEFLLLLVLIIIANGAPILARVLLNDRFNLAIDFGKKLPDGYYIFGTSKTWRGVLSACICTTIVALLVDHTATTGLLIAIFAIIGDLTSSFIKRRLAMKSSSMAPLLDQIPESLLPALIMMPTFDLDIQSVIILVLIFVITDNLLSRTLYRWHIRKRPY